MSSSTLWNIDPKTGDYVVGADGAPVLTEALTVPAYYRLKIKRTQWLYADDTTLGSDFYLQKKHRTTQNPSLLEAVAARALQPIVDDGRASNIQVTTTVTARNAVGMEIKVTDARGNAQETTVIPIGG